MFLNVVGSRFGKSVKVSIEAGELVITEVDKSTLPRFDVEKDMTAHVAALKCWEQKLCAQVKENYNKLNIVTLQRLSTVCGVLCSIFYVRLKGRLEAEPEYQTMCNTKRFCSMNL